MSKQQGWIIVAILAAILVVAVVGFFGEEVAELLDTRTTEEKAFYRALGGD